MLAASRDAVLCLGISLVTVVTERQRGNSSASMPALSHMHCLWHKLLALFAELTHVVGGAQHAYSCTTTRAWSCVFCSNRPSMYNSCIGSFVAQTFLYKQHCWGNQLNRTTDTISSNHTTCLQQCYCTHVNIQLAGGSPTDNNRTEQQAADSERFIHYDWPSVGNCRRQLVVTAAQEAQSYFTTL